MLSAMSPPSGEVVAWFAMDPPNADGAQVVVSLLPPRRGGTLSDAGWPRPTLGSCPQCQSCEPVEEAGVKVMVADSAAAMALELGVCGVHEGGVRRLRDRSASPQAAYLPKDEGFVQGRLLGLGVLRGGWISSGSPGRGEDEGGWR